MLRRILSNFLSYRRYRGGVWYLVKIYDPDYRGVVWKDSEPKDLNMAVLVEWYKVKELPEIINELMEIHKKNSNLN